MPNNEMQNNKGKRVAIVGAGPGGVSAAIALSKSGYDVKLYERHPAPEPLGGAVLLSVPVLAILRYYGISIDNFGSKTSVEFRNHKGKVRSALQWNPLVEKSFGIPGWHYGVLRKSAFGKMMEVLPEDILIPGKSFSHYEEKDDDVTLHFDDGSSADADILIGSDGIRSRVSKQAFGDPQLFHCGIRVWLAWCDPLEGLPTDTGAITHSHKYQASYFPMLHDGKQGFEWWIVEPWKENAPEPTDRKAYIHNILKDFADPIPRFLDQTNLETQIFPWDIYNRPSLDSWSNGRVICIGDAVHPVSPYAAYGMGMAIEDGYFLADKLNGADLSDLSAVQSGFAEFEKLRVKYVNHNVEFARTLGNVFHKMPYPLAKIRDFVYDNTKILDKQINKGYLQEQEDMCLQMKSLHLA